MAALVVLSFVVFLVVTAGLAVSARYSEATGLPETSPSFGAPRKPAGETRIVFLGDDLLHGGMSDDVVGRLVAHFAPCNARLFNAARIGETLSDVSRRSDEAIRVSPDFVVLQAGLRDARLIADPRYRERKEHDGGLPEAATLAGYASTLRALLDDIATRSPAKVIVVALPFFGEDVAAPVNAVVRSLNDAAHDAAVDAGAEWLDFHTDLHAALSEAQQERRRRFEALGELPPSVSPRFDESTYPKYFAAAVLGRSLGKSWNQVSASRGLLVHTDLLHLNERSGRRLARAIAERLTALDAGLRRPASDRDRSATGVAD